MPDLPRYQDLPRASNGGRSAWNLFGRDDNLGLVNLMTPDKVAAGATLVRKGQIFPLDMPLGSIAPALSASRGVPRHRVLHRQGSGGFDDVYDNFYPQASSQRDSLGQIAYWSNELYNGATEAAVRAGKRNTIEHWSQHGMAGRSVILVGARALASDGRPYDPGEAIAFGVEELDLARHLANVVFLPGDVILMHTGFAAWYLNQSYESRQRLHGNVIAPGLAHTEAVCEYLWDSHAAAIASDNYSVEVSPFDTRPEAQPMGFIHQMLIGQFGMALGELWWLKDLADDCAADSVYEAFFVSAPLHAPGGIGSTANAVAIK